MEEWYKISNIDTIDSPALVIYPDRVKKNIELLVSMINDISRLRPHVKTHKTKEAALMQMEAGIKKFKCATIAEAEMLGSINAPDVLLAYQPIGPKADRFIALIKKYPDTKFSCLVDDGEAAKAIATKASNAEIVIPVYIDLNIGMNRTGIFPDQRAIDLYKLCSSIKGINSVGLHAYDGHIHDKDFDTRKKKCDEAFAKAEKVKEEITKAGIPEPIIIAGGSPTFPIHAKRKNIECSPGTFIYWDAGYQQGLAEQAFLPAALVITRVISHPAENIFCTDLGHKSNAAEKDLDHRVRFLNATEVKFIGQSEEHLVMQTDQTDHYKVGDVLYGVPFHICPTCALYERALIVENGKVNGEWRIIGRDRKISV